MNATLLAAACFQCLFFVFISPGKVRGHTVSITVINKCLFQIWPSAAPNTGHAVLADGGFHLESGHSRLIEAPGNWSGRIWARTGCNFDANSRQPACQTGDCDGRLACNGLIGTPPATLVEISLHADKNTPSYYDVSLVDGYNLPVSITTWPASSACSIRGCLKDLKSVCPAELEVVNEDGEVVACKSACLAFGADSFCCRNEYGSAGKCKPSVYSKLFKDACSWYYSYAFDAPSPLVSCGVTELFITFCPAKWGDDGDDQYESV
ncbi:hypothetical protein Nepgr_032952 [Nepenthes gracilis]|uniref:Thaumatin-like protein n=1 Tax=Nepenthes gracilis TaxID=150966 RepID=A0AAD3Y8A2_NEPGR|nr:hypothetical protein Nepgr_032952 [Nepenthes gracilis]